MASNQVIGDITRTRDRFAMLGMGKAKPEHIFYAATRYLSWHPDVPQPETPSHDWPLPNSVFDPSDNFRENMVTGCALIVLAIEAQDRLNKAERRDADAKIENAKARFSTVLKNDEIRIVHDSEVIYHDFVSEDGYLTLKDVRYKAAGATYGEVVQTILAAYGAQES